MKPTKPKNEEQEQPKDLDEFEQFVKAIWSVPKEEVDRLRSTELAKPSEKEKRTPTKKNYSKKGI